MTPPTDLCKTGLFAFSMDNSFYSVLSDDAKKIAPQVEKLLLGLSIEDANRLLGRVRMSISAQSKVSTLYLETALSTSETADVTEHNSL